MEKGISFLPIINQLGIKLPNPPSKIPPWEVNNYNEAQALREAAKLSAIAYLGLATLFGLDYRNLLKIVNPYVSSNHKHPPRSSCLRFTTEVVPQALAILTETKQPPTILGVCTLGMLRTIIPENYALASCRQNILSLLIKNDELTYGILCRYPEIFDGSRVILPNNSGNCS